MSSPSTQFLYKTCLGADIALIGNDGGISSLHVCFGSANKQQTKMTAHAKMICLRVTPTPTREKTYSGCGFWSGQGQGRPGVKHGKDGYDEYNSYALRLSSFVLPVHLRTTLDHGFHQGGDVHIVSHIPALTRALHLPRARIVRRFA